MTAVLDETMTTLADVPRRAAQDAVDLRDGDGKLLLRFDPVSRTAVIALGDAELTLQSVDGAIEVTSACAIRIRSQKGVELIGGTDSRVSVGRDAVRVTAAALDASVTETHFVGRSLTARGDRVKVTWGTCERIVGRAFDYARHAYHRVDALLHVRAGRIRTETEGTHVVHAGAARLHADEDVRIQGKAINLG